MDAINVVVIVVSYLMVLQIGVMLGWRWGKEVGQRLEVRTMIELMEALKIDNWEQSVFRDRLVTGLKWVLDGKRKKDRDAEKS